MEKLELISNVLCPYTQRAVIQLLELDLPFERIYVDLANKPGWLLELSPLGKVPVLRTREGAVFETSVICEYIEETAPRGLHPRLAFERARHRAWIEFSAAVIGDIYQFYTAPDAAGLARKAGDLHRKMTWLERNLSGGPYFAGETFHLVDAAFAPIFRLFDGFDRIGDFGLLKGCDRVHGYRAALGARDSVRLAVRPDYGAVFDAYLRGQNAHLARLMGGAEMAASASPA